MAQRVGIIGAGIAGLAAARTLRAAGVDATLFDKGRGPGGRMATRWAGDLRFDHGAQYFTARGPDFRALVAQWRAAGLAAAWGGDAYVGTPEMNSPLRALAAAQTLLTGCPVTALRRAADGRWTVAGADGPLDAPLDAPIEAPGNGDYAAVILAVPAPQAVPLAASAGVVFPAIDPVRYAPCWALMLAFDRPVELPTPWLRPDDAAIAWIARDAARPGRSSRRETVVVHATPSWSRHHLEADPSQVAELLWAAARPLIGGDGPEPCFRQAHRWRYALVEQAAGHPFLWDADTGLGACGDWCRGPRVEAAFDSGVALARHVIATLAGAALPGDVP